MNKFGISWIKCEKFGKSEQKGISLKKLQENLRSLGKFGKKKKFGERGANGEK